MSETRYKIREISGTELVGVVYVATCMDKNPFNTQTMWSLSIITAIQTALIECTRLMNAGEHDIRPIATFRVHPGLPVHGVPVRYVHGFSVVSVLLRR